MYLNVNHNTIICNIIHIFIYTVYKKKEFKDIVYDSSVRNIISYVIK